MEQTTIITPTRNCWCKNTRGLIGKHILVADLPRPPRVDATISVVTDIDHTITATGPRCWLILDGWHRWPLPATGDQVTVTTTDEPTTLGQRIREPLRHDGPMTLEDAAHLITEYEISYRLAGAAIPHTPGGSTRGRRAFTPKTPATPQTARSYFTRGRIRRIPATGRWAADQGWAGTTRQLGEYDTPADAEQRIIAATTGAWDVLEAWLFDHVGGDWHLVRDTTLDIEIQDRLTVRETAELAGVEERTFTGYVARGQAPAATGKDASGRDYWDRSVILAWMDNRPGQGRRQ